MIFVNFISNSIKLEASDSKIHAKLKIKIG